MAAVVAELKARLAEITAKAQELRAEIVALEGQKTAFETVIQSYDPTYVTRVQAPAKRGTASLDAASKRVTELLKGRNNRHLALEILRRSDRPLTSLEMAHQFLVDECLEDEKDDLSTALANRFSGTVDGLQKQGLARHAGMIGGHKRLWEINR